MNVSTCASHCPVERHGQRQITDFWTRSMNAWRISRACNPPPLFPFGAPCARRNEGHRYRGFVPNAGRPDMKSIFYQCSEHRTISRAMGHPVDGWPMFDARGLTRLRPTRHYQQDTHALTFWPQQNSMRRRIRPSVRRTGPLSSATCGHVMNAGLVSGLRDNPEL